MLFYFIKYEILGGERERKSAILCSASHNSLHMGRERRERNRERQKGQRERERTGET